MNSLTGETINSPQDTCAQERCLPVQGVYVPEHKLEDAVNSLSGRVMAVVTFGETSYQGESDCLRIQVPSVQLGETAFAEIWFSDTPCTAGKEGRISFTRNDDILFGSIALKIDPSKNLLDEEVESLYDEIDAMAIENGYPHFHRIWNYIPFINDEPDGLENYRRFSVGRHNALEKDRINFTNDLPAASALGITQNELIIFFIAGKSPGVQIENPRQVNAYLYPREYGPRSPSFARAKLVKWKNGIAFYISGTASIVGHETVHEDDAGDQLKETMKNIDALIAQTENEIGTYRMRDLTMIKVYLRNSGLYPIAKKLIEDEVGVDIPVVYLQADVCRTDLLLEIEAVYQVCHP